MAITAVGTATASNNGDAVTNSLTITWNKTGLAANDILEARILYGFGSAETMPTPSGWTKAVAVGSTTTTLSYAVFYRLVTQADLDNVGLTSFAFANSATGLDMAGTIQAFRGVDTATPLSGTPVIVDSTGAPTFTTALSLAGLNNPDSGACLSVGYACRTNAVATKPILSTPPTGYTMWFNALADAAGVKTAASSSARATRAGYEIRAATGARAAVTATCSQSVAYIAAGIMYKPLVVGAAVPKPRIVVSRKALVRANRY